METATPQNTETQKMTLHKALSELKLIDAKIMKQTSEIIPVASVQKDKKINGHIDETDFSKSANSNYDSVLALLERKVKIKKAIVSANATTKVTIADKEMFIADAISYKSAIELKKQFINTLLARYNKVVADLNLKNESVKTQCDRMLEATLGKEKSQTNAEDVKKMQEMYMATNEWKFVDPLTLAEKLKSLAEEVQQFESNVDAELSTINATTFIELN